MEIDNHSIAARVAKLEAGEEAAHARYKATSGEIADRARDRIVELQTYLAAIEDILGSAGF